MEDEGNTCEHFTKNFLQNKNRFFHKNYAPGGWMNEWNTLGGREFFFFFFTPQVREIGGSFKSPLFDR